MIGSKRVVCVIPARLKSSRFPKKMLALLYGRPLLQWVWESATSVKLFDEVVFAVDAEETAQLIQSFGGRSVMTSVACASGTDRLVELMQRKVIDADLWVNWQGDEPFVHEQMILDLLQSSALDESDLWTLKKRITNPEDVASPHCVKVVCDHRGYALYFSRSPIPFYRDHADFGRQKYFKHIGLYAFTREALQTISALRSCEIEMAEQLEQLRFLFHNLRIRVHETEHEVLGIDLPEHLERAETLVRQRALSGARGGHHPGNSCVRSDEHP